MKTTVRELIDELEQYDDDAEVRLAFQPNYPLQYHVGNVREDDGHEHRPVIAVGHHDDVIDQDDVWYCDSDGECGAEWDHEPRGEELGGDEKDPVVYIGEGGQVYDAPYLPGSARDALGWST